MAWRRMLASRLSSLCCLPLLFPLFRFLFISLPPFLPSFFPSFFPHAGILASHLPIDSSVA